MLEKGRSFSMKKKNKYKEVMEKESENIRKFAKGIMIAFCLQFLIYLIVLNLLPLGNDKNKNGQIEFNEINGMYYETWDGYGQYKIDDKNVYIDNGIQFVYYYNVLILTAVTLLCFYYMIVFLEKYDRKVSKTISQFFKENKGLLFLLLFMVWTFLSCIFAKDLFRSFMGSYNLRDGYIAFMGYGSILICMLLMGYNNEKAKKIILNLFIISTTIVATLTLIHYYSDNFPILIKQIPTESTSGIFNNSNHYGYLLSIAVTAIAAMTVKEKNISYKGLYALCFVIQSWMLILNNTFGAYIGVSVALFVMFIYEIFLFFSKKYRTENNFSLYTMLLLMSVFVVFSGGIKNASGDVIVVNNIKGISKDIVNITSSLKSSGEESTGGYAEEIISGEQTNANVTEAAEAGSGRWKLWVGAWQLIKERPIMGWGLENMKAEYIRIGIGEGRSHSLIFQLGGTTGIVGLGLYLAGIICIFLKNLKNFKLWDIYTYTSMFVIISYMISSLVGNSIFYVSGYFYIFVAMAAIPMISSKEKEDEKVIKK